MATSFCLDSEVAGEGSLARTALSARKDDSPHASHHEVVVSFLHDGQMSIYYGTKEA
jgi:hypothetical protein